jgi:hypothetical protein
LKILWLYKVSLTSREIKCFVGTPVSVDRKSDENKSIAKPRLDKTSLLVVLFHPLIHPSVQLHTRVSYSSSTIQIHIKPGGYPISASTVVLFNPRPHNKNPSCSNFNTSFSNILFERMMKTLVFSSLETTTIPPTLGSTVAAAVHSRTFRECLRESRSIRNRKRGGR